MTDYRSSEQANMRKCAEIKGLKHEREASS